MAYLVSPGIISNEIDQTNITPAFSTSVGAFAGHFNWGPVDEIVTVGSEKELAQSFGAPASGSATTRSFLTAASFLKYSSALRVSRAIGSGALNAADANPILIKNKDHFDTLSSLDFIFSARYPGAIGNSLTVSYAHVSGTADSAYTNWEYSGLFDSAPNQSSFATNAGVDAAQNDEIHLVVIDTDGLVSGTRGTVLEKFEGLSLGSNAKSEEGASIFYKDVINTNSAYIFVNTLSETFDAADSPITADSVFAVALSAVESEATLELPFILTTETTVTYSGGASVTSEINDVKVITVKAGYTGAEGNNSKFNIRLLDKDDAPAVAAHGFIKYGVPVNGDTVVVNGTTLTKAASLGAAAFSTISELNGLVTAIAGLDSIVANGHILITDTTAGAAGNTKTLALGESNAVGSMTISGPTLTGGFDVDSLDYVAVTIDSLDEVNGYITYDVIVATDAVTVGPDTTLVSDVTLASIINEIAYQSALETAAAFESISFELDGEAILATDPEASMKFDFESVIPWTASNQAVLKVIPFTGGEVVSYNDNTLINTYALTAGVDGASVPGDVATALELFADKDVVIFDLLHAEVFNTSQETVDAKIYEIVNGRQDCTGFVSAPIEIASLTSNAAKKAAVINKFANPVYSSSSYVIFDETPVYTYNKYADSYMWIPAAGHMAGLCAHTDFVADPWFSPAGFNRGQLKGVTKIAYNPGQTDRDDLYKARINSIVSIPGQGVVLYGDKTALSKPSAFDRINVRRLFNVLKRSISDSAKYQLFELNDEFTRASFKNTIEPFLRDVQGRRGIIDFRVVCDETNNTAQVIDANEFVGQIFVKPSRSINYIRLDFVATRTGVDFKEIVGA